MYMYVTWTPVWSLASIFGTMRDWLAYEKPDSVPTKQTTCSSFDPLSPDIKKHILLTVLHTFLIKLVRRASLNIKTSYPL